MDNPIERTLSEIRKNSHSLNWWRNRVFIPYIVGTLTQLHPGYPGYDEAVRVTEEDWDNLIILDACRADAFERVVDTEQFDEYRSVPSLGSHSSEWTRQNFANKQFGDIVYVSANPHTSMIAGNSFHSLVEMWNTDVDENTGIVPPKAMVDATRDIFEEYPNKRLIIHFMQPHAPFIGSDEDLDDISPPSQFWKAYDENLEFVLKYVYELLEDIPGKTVITSDHGTMRPTHLGKVLGLEWHKPRLRNPAVSMVPWAVIENERREIVSGSTEDQSTSENVDERLRDLGYKL